jgi:hypothetical protein
VLLSNLTGAQRRTTPEELLPHSFGARQLDENARGESS